MRKINNFVFVPNMQHGACLLFDRKGLGRYQSWEFINNRFARHWLHPLHMLRKRITENIQQMFFAAL